MDRDPASEASPPPPINWWPMIFSIFIVFFPLALLKRAHVTLIDWTIAAFAVVSFVGLIAIAVAFWQRRRPFLWVPILLAAIGFVLANYNYTAELFFVFAAAMVPWAVNGDAHRSAIVTLLLLGAEAFRALLEPSWEFKTLWLLDAPIFTIGNAACGLWIVGMTLSIRRLARVAEQERITQELHDALGQVLSWIALKSQVAGLMLEQADVERARRAIAEVETISRGTLAEVRQAIRRYRFEPPEIMPRARRRGSADGKPPPINWWPMVFAIYIVYLPVGFQRGGGGTAFEWLLVAMGVAVFLALAAIAIASWQRRRSFLRVVFLLALLGVAFVHLTPAAMVFIAFAAAVVPWAVQGDVSRTAGLTALLIILEFVIGAWTGVLQPEQAASLREIWWVTVPIFTAVSATGYLWAVRMSLRHLALAKRTECERIARDLHDVLGHTLSLITLKSELAGRLLAEAHTVERATLEITDVHDISHRALVDVRRTILGSRTETLEAEFERATTMLRTAGIAVDCQREPVQLASEHEGVLGLALREAVTNIVRHAAASRCEIRLQHVSQHYVLEVQDDGLGGLPSEGLGLLGMRERIEAIGGSVLREISAGTRLTVSLPALSAST